MNVDQLREKLTNIVNKGQEFAEYVNGEYPDCYNPADNGNFDDTFVDGQEYGEYLLACELLELL